MRGERLLPLQVRSTRDPLHTSAVPANRALCFSGSGKGKILGVRPLAMAGGQWGLGKSTAETESVEPENRTRVCDTKTVFNLSQ